MAIWIASHMKGLAIELKRRLQDSVVLSTSSFKNTFTESERRRGMMLQTGLYKLRDYLFPYF
jgi:hypothetical protein